ncbi:MAG: HNH endonuclease [Proteobacteria bacterium]|nr:MAG: HNH endonuclease [Pseudomonadota bacterium]
MIRLVRPPKPDELLKNENNWLTEYSKAASNGSVPDSLARKYSRPSIKEALLKATFSKCMYCESKPLATASCDVEHIKPKSLFPNLIFVWENLGIVCKACNTAKSNRHNEQVPIVNPFEEEPNNFFISVGPYLYALPGNDRAILTADHCKLNRPELLEKRSEKIRELVTLLDRIARTPSPAREIFQRELEIFIAENSEFSFFLKGTFEQFSARIK